MTPEIKYLKEFYLIGKAVRTTNENGQAQKDIGALWQQFLNEQVIEKIPNKESNDVYCVYTDYETDHNGPYTTLLGCKVTSLTSVPEGLIYHIIEANRYQVYESTGKIPDCVLATWMHIWQSDIDRKYSADFDIYSSELQDLEKAEVSTYLSVH